MNAVSTLTKVALALGVVLTVITVGYWGRYWFLVPTRGGMADALFWTFITVVMYGIGMAGEQYGGA